MLSSRNSTGLNTLADSSTLGGSIAFGLQLIEAFEQKEVLLNPGETEAYYAEAFGKTELWPLVAGFASYIHNLFHPSSIQALIDCPEEGISCKSGPSSNSLNGNRTVPNLVFSYKAGYLPNLVYKLLYEQDINQQDTNSKSDNRILLKLPSKSVDLAINGFNVDRLRQILIQEQIILNYDLVCAKVYDLLDVDIPELEKDLHKLQKKILQIKGSYKTKEALERRIINETICVLSAHSHSIVDQAEKATKEYINYLKEIFPNSFSSKPWFIVCLSETTTQITVVEEGVFRVILLLLLFVVVYYL